MSKTVLPWDLKKKKIIVHITVEKRVQQKQNYL